VCQFKVIKRHFTALRLGRSATGVTITRLAPFRTNREHRQLFSEYFHAFGADPHVPVSKSKPMPAHLPASPDKPLYEFNLKGTETSLVAAVAACHPGTDGCSKQSADHCTNTFLAAVVAIAAVAAAVIMVAAFGDRAA